MKSPRFAIENVLLHLSEHFTYLNSREDKGVRIIEGLLYPDFSLIWIAKRSGVDAGVQINEDPLYYLP